MVIDWKRVAASPGYKSLKAAMVHDIQNAEKTAQKGRHPIRKKKEFTDLFKWVIARATHYAHCTGSSLEHILEKWESKRKHWWLNYYQDSRQPKLTQCPNLRPAGLRSIRTYYKKSDWGIRAGKGKFQQELHRLAVQKRTKKARLPASSKSMLVWRREQLVKARAKALRKVNP